MTALNKQALREAAERAASDSWGYDRDEFNDAITPEVVLALLDELESRTVTVRLPEYRNSPDMHTKQYYEAIGFNQGLDGCVEALTAAGIQVIEGEG